MLISLSSDGKGSPPDSGYYAEEITGLLKTPKIKLRDRSTNEQFDELMPLALISALLV
jgi:hypothetical protein